MPYSGDGYGFDYDEDRNRPGIGRPHRDRTKNKAQRTARRKARR